MKKLLRSFLVPTFSFFLGCYPAFGQTDDDEFRNLMKYWQYRERLLADVSTGTSGFVVKGIGAGKSLPWIQRYPIQNCNAGTACGSCNGNSLLDEDGAIATGMGIVDFGSDVTAGLGWYISVLATEYKLLVANGQNTDKTLTELYYTIRAYDRLDLYGETWFGKTSRLNGYFARCDADEHLLNFIPGYCGVLSPVTCECPESPPPSCSPPVDCEKWTTNQMSQDQVVYLLMGMALIKKCFPDEAIDLPGILPHFNFTEHAKRITDLMITHIRDGRRGAFGVGTWRIIRPDGHAVTKGSQAKNLSWGLADAAKYITGDNYQNAWSRIYGHTIWWRLKNNTVDARNIFAGNDVNGTMVMTLAAINNEFDEEEFNDYCDEKRKLIFPYLRAFLHDDKFDIRPSYTYYETIWFPPFGYVTSPRSEPTYDEILNSAPCDGPCHDRCDDSNPLDPYDPSNPLHQQWGDDCQRVDPEYQKTCNSPDGWLSTQRWMHTQDRNGTGTNTHPAERNGLDYMLAYNLYNLVLRSKYDLPYFNVFDSEHYVTGNYAKITNSQSQTGCKFCYETHGQKSSKTRLASDASILKDNISPYNHDGHMTFRAEEAIVLRPGFNVENGAFFHAFIDDFECSDGSTGDGKIYKAPSLETDSNAVDSTAIYRDDLFSPNMDEESGNYHIKAYPNPFSKTTTIEFTLSQSSVISLAVFNLSGQKIADLAGSASLASGTHQFEFDGSSHPSGFYIYKFLVGNDLKMGKLILVKGN